MQGAAAQATRRLGLITLLVYAASFLIPFFLEKGPELFESCPKGSVTGWASFLYQKAVKAGYRKPTNNYVALVTLSKNEPSEVRTNPCLLRKFEARLLRTLESAQPAVIVFDLYFSPDRCLETEDPERGTQELRDAIHEVSRSVPIVFGRLGYNEDRLRREWPDEFPRIKRRGFRSTQLILAPTLEFTDKEHPQVTSGLVNLNCDVRKIPLKWPAYSGMAFVGNETPQDYDSLALAALRAYSPDERILSTVERLQSEGKHPFTSFLSEKEFLSRTASAFRLVCGASHRSDDWRGCTLSDASPSELQKFRHRVAIIGWNDPEMVPSEYFESVIGDTAGVFLQANYIESLLDHRILTPVRLRVSILLTLLWFLVIEVIFRRWSARPEIALLYSLGSTLALAAIVYDWVVIQLGYYLVVWFPGILAILGRYSVLRLRSGGTE